MTFKVSKVSTKSSLDTKFFLYSERFVYEMENIVDEMGDRFIEFEIYVEKYTQTVIRTFLNKEDYDEFMYKMSSNEHINKEQIIRETYDKVNNITTEFFYD